MINEIPGEESPVTIVTPRAFAPLINRTFGKQKENRSIAFSHMNQMKIFAKDQGSPKLLA